MATRRGALILIEGVDRAGKSTQCTRLTEHLKSKNSINVNYMRFPDRQTPTGQIIDQYLRSNLHVDDHSIHLLYSANRWKLPRTFKVLLHLGPPLSWIVMPFLVLLTPMQKVFPLNGVRHQIEDFQVFLFLFFFENEYLQMSFSSFSFFHSITINFFST